jgi:hypothetical protein
LVGKHWSEQWRGQFQNNAHHTCQYMQPYYRHNWEIRGHRENTEGIKTTDDAMWLKGTKEKTTYMLKEIRSIELVSNT